MPYVLGSIFNTLILFFLKKLQRLGSTEACVSNTISSTSDTSTPGMVNELVFDTIRFAARRTGFSV